MDPYSAFHVNADPDPAFQFDADPDQQHWFLYLLEHVLELVTFTVRYRYRYCAKMKRDRSLINGNDDVMNFFLAVLSQSYIRNRFETSGDLKYRFPTSVHIQYFI